MKATGPYQIVLLFFSVTTAVTNCHSVKSSVEKELIRDLVSRYKTEGEIGRPVARATDTVMVNFSVSLIQILDVDEKNQVLTTNIWYHYQWTDVMLQWKPSRHDNITSIRLPAHTIWLPDVRLYNFADDRLAEKRDTLVVVKHTGDLMWMPQAILNSSCTFDILFFPFDSQTCRLKFGSWTYNVNMLNIDFMDGRQELDLTQYITSNEWEIVGNLGSRNVKYYSCCSKPFPDVTFTIKLERKIVFYTLILILPCGLLSLLTLVIFWVPPENPAKLQLGMNIFLAFFVLLLVLADLTPTSASSVPLIGAFYCLSMVMITMSTVLPCVVANMYFRGVRINRAPWWLRSCVLDVAARLLNIREVLRERPKQSPITLKKLWSTYVTRNQSNHEKFVAKVMLLNPHQMDTQNLEDYGTFQEEVAGDSNKPEPSTFIGDPLSSDATTPVGTANEEAALISEVISIRELMDEEVTWRQGQEEGNTHIHEWRMIATVMDRIFFFIYVVTNLLGLGSIFLRSYFS